MKTIADHTALLEQASRAACALFAALDLRRGWNGPSDTWLLDRLERDPDVRALRAIMEARVP